MPVNEQMFTVMLFEASLTFDYYLVLLFV